MLGYLSLAIICYLKLTVFLELCSRKTVRFSEQIMSPDKYPSIFSCQTKAVVYITNDWAFNSHCYNNTLLIVWTVTRLSCMYFTKGNRKIPSASHVSTSKSSLGAWSKIWITITEGKTNYSPTSVKRPPSIKRPLSKVPIYLSVICCIWYL